MSTKHDITSLDDIKLLVDTFYNKVGEDVLLAPVFNQRLGDGWLPHLEKMYTFWQTLLLQEHTYNGAPFPPHARLPIDEKHFNEWLNLFTATVDSLFAGEKADEAKWRAGKMAEMFQYKIAYFKNNPHNIV
ncbi:group III truncated hemoglobin [Mucilaginibacter sp. AW1-7]|jgi:hemoglobin|uniref:group III truncated hemoglobin n=1 Tax=unclassified Mucilaginibacter TaxID=2617802 RepID=UPI002366CDE1|nr:group III truncated hemoglobin [Mucilaginibacter sp. KACC 22773]WDF79956.1 group III truncated hemoglobin [Mucilaginibacter sp. KACC 22773]